MKKIVFLIAIGFLLTSCYKDSISTETKGDFKVEFLFEKNGIKMYRFRDGGRYHYFTDRGETITTQYSNKSTREENIY